MKSRTPKPAKRSSGIARGVEALREEARRARMRLEGAGHALAPVDGENLDNVSTFWGKAWFAQLELYLPFVKRRTQIRSVLRCGMLLDLHLQPGRIFAQMQDRLLCRVNITVPPLAEDRWEQLIENCGGGIDATVDLLKGKISTAVLETMTGAEGSLLPSFESLGLRCSCGASVMPCLHIVTALFGAGLRVDAKPDLLFTLRQVHFATLKPRPIIAPTESSAVRLDPSRLTDIFGIEFAEPPTPRRRPEPT